MYGQTGRFGTCGANRDRVPQSTAKRGADEMLLSTGVTKGRARLETHAEITLSSLSLLAQELCPYLPHMSQVAPSDGMLLSYE